MASQCCPLFGKLTDRTCCLRPVEDFLTFRASALPRQDHKKASAITKTADREVGMVSPRPKVPYNQKCRDSISCTVTVRVTRAPRRPILSAACSRRDPYCGDHHLRDYRRTRETKPC